MQIERDPQTAETISVLLVDDHAVLLDGLSTMLDAEPDIEVVGCASSRAEALAQATERQPMIAVVDLVIPGGGLRAIHDIRVSCPGTKVMALTVLDDAEHLKAVFAQGGSGYLVKRIAARELLAAIRTIHHGGEYWGTATGVRPDLQPVPEPAARVDLSQRETQVLRLLSRGYTHREIAERLEISKKSVDTYRLRLQEKVGGRGRADLVRYAIASGLFGESVAL